MAEFLPKGIKNNHVNDDRIVLLVEDDADDVLLVMDALAERPVKLVHERNGFEALTYLSELRAKAETMPCLIILDMNMPIINGKQLLSILKKEESFQQIPIIVFTTSSNNRYKEYCDQLNVPMITKPYDLQTFNNTVQIFIEHCNVS